MNETDKHEKAYSILRRLRWKKGVRCTSCGADKNINIIDCSSYNHKYSCGECGNEFYDDTKTPLNSKNIVEWITVLMMLLSKINTNDLSHIQKISSSTGISISDILIFMKEIKKSFFHKDSNAAAITKFTDREEKDHIEYEREIRKKRDMDKRSR